jgi:hypothetical protein
MRLMAVSAALIVFAINGAYAQQQPRTCSGIKSRCEQNCTGHRSGGPCAMNCDSAYNTCMQTGEWRGVRNTFTNVQRR